MRKLLAIIGAIALVIVAALGGTLGYLAYKGYVLDKDGETFVDDVVQNIVAKGDRDELFALCTPGALQKTSTSQADNFFNIVGGLGPLTKYEGSKGRVSASTWNGKTSITGEYVAVGEFQNGSARFLISLDRHDGRWRITGLHVEPGRETHLDRSA